MKLFKTSMGHWCVAGLLVASVTACGDDRAKGSQDDTQADDADVSEVEDTASDVEPDVGQDVGPDDEDVGPEVEDVEPDIEDVEPDIEDVEPDIEDVGPEVEDVEPDIEDIEPEVEDVEPEIEDVEPEIEDVEPDIEDIEPEIVDPCPPEAVEASTSALIGGRCAYFYNSESVVWPDADAACHARGMRLIAIRSAEEDAELTAWISQHQNSTWIGLNDIAEEGTFVWSMGGDLGSEAPKYLPESIANAPGTDCVVTHVLSDPAEWLALTCDNHVRMYTCTFE